MKSVINVLRQGLEGYKNDRNGHSKHTGYSNYNKEIVTFETKLL